MSRKTVLICSLAIPPFIVGFIPTDYGYMNQPQVQNEMRQSAPRDDRELAQKIEYAIKGGNGKPRFDGIAVEVHSGRVILRGTVKSLKKSSEIERRVRDVRGVFYVENQIVVDTEPNTYIE